jgi:poly-gamma-glutamate synthesis protein (capsule biosynthesis protein)
VLLAAALAGCSLAGCSLGAPGDEAADTTGGADDAEPAETALTNDVPLDLPDETADPALLAPAPLDATATTLLDVRGVGDTAFTRTHENDPMPAGLGAALDRFDPTGAILRGDLSFVNFESVVGDHCDAFSKPYVQGRSYAFLSRPENLAQAYAHGFNLVGLSNNHTRDCAKLGDMEGESTSSKMTVASLDAIETDAPVLYAGVSAKDADKRVAKVATFHVKGRDVRVAFADVYTGRSSCPLATCQSDAKAVMESLRDAQADLRILALHSQDSQPALVQTAMDFIQIYGGDVVFGHGPHVWKPVRVARKPDGSAGVIFESLGNFLHPGCAAQSRNIVGRALYDQHMKLRQVQIVPVRNAGTDVVLSSADARTLPSNLKWTARAELHGAYANVKP